MRFEGSCHKHRFCCPEATDPRTSVVFLHKRTLHEAFDIAAIGDARPKSLLLCLTHPERSPPQSLTSFWHGILVALGFGWLKKNAF